MSGEPHIALFCGDDAATSDIVETLSEDGTRITRVGEGHDLVTSLAEMSPQAVLIAGTSADNRDGRIQGVCEALGLPYTHSGIAATALANDRHMAKLVFKSAGLPVTDHVLADLDDVLQHHVLPPPYVVKSRFAGQGGRLAIARHAEELSPAELRGADWADTDTVMVERYLPGVTVNVYIMGDVAIGAAALTEPGVNTASEILIPAPISPKIYEECTRLALRAHGVLGCRGVTALALRYDVRQPASEPVVLGLDPQPDLSRMGPLSQIAARAGHSYQELLRWVVQDASCGRMG